MRESSRGAQLVQHRGEVDVNSHAGAAIGLGLLGAGIGLSKGAVFLHPIALAILPATVVRYAAITTIGAGSGAAALGCWITPERPQRVADVPAAATSTLSFAL